MIALTTVLPLRLDDKGLGMLVTDDRNISSFREATAGAKGTTVLRYETQGFFLQS